MQYIKFSSSHLRKRWQRIKINAALSSEIELTQVAPQGSILGPILLNIYFNPLGAKITKWSNTLKQFVRKLPATCLSVFDHSVGLALNDLNDLTTWVNDLFLTLPKISIFNLADKRNCYAFNSSLEVVLQNLWCNLDLAFTWFESNYMKRNTKR